MDKNVDLVLDRDVRDSRIRGSRRKLGLCYSRKIFTVLDRRRPKPRGAPILTTFLVALFLMMAFVIYLTIEMTIYQSLAVLVAAIALHLVASSVGFTKLMVLIILK